MSKPWIKRGVVVAAALVAAVMAWRHFDKKGADVTYEMGTVDRGMVEKSISSTGSVAALVTVEVGSQISGQVSALHADFNSRVKKGDLLAVIDPQTYQQRVAQAEADMAVARANMGSQQASLRKAQTTVEQARRDFERQQQLAERQLIAQTAIEDSRKQLELSESDLIIAQAQIKNAEAALQTRQASLEQARIDLSRTQIRSPIDGVVISRSVDLGQTVAASLQAPVLFKIAQDLSQIQIEAKVDEADIGSIEPEDQATFTVDAFPDQTFPGRVAQVRLAATTTQNVVTYSVMIQAENPDQMLLPGMTANVRIVTDRREEVLRVPNDAARYQPADQRSNQTSQASAQQGRSGAQQGGAMLANNPQLMKELGLTGDQEQRLQKAIQQVQQQIQAQQQASGPGALSGVQGGNNFNNREAQAMRNRFENAIASVLTPEQLEKFRQLRSQRGNQPQTRQGTLWTLVDGSPRMHQVQLGVSDDRYTEVVEVVDGGPIEVGTQVIMRSRTGMTQ
ncbi:MAG TPA: efflux RND transporter periplasmic adaptor subunit [Steroidobacteraceae bacterium]|nr:efflux RND transporter periplasmic adaptor subunit [Steroidobacteraceae bacterium]